MAEGRGAGTILLRGITTALVVAARARKGMRKSMSLDGTFGIEFGGNREFGNLGLDGCE